MSDRPLNGLAREDVLQEFRGGLRINIEADELTQGPSRVTTGFIVRVRGPAASVLLLEFAPRKHPDRIEERAIEEIVAMTH